MDKTAHLTQELKKMAGLYDSRATAVLSESFYRGINAPVGHKLPEAGRGFVNQLGSGLLGLAVGAGAGYSVAKRVSAKSPFATGLIAASILAPIAPLVVGYGAPERMKKSVKARNVRRGKKLLAARARLKKLSSAKMEKNATGPGGDPIMELEQLLSKKKDMTEALSLGLDVPLSKFTTINESLRDLYRNNKDQIDRYEAEKGALWGAGLGGTLALSSKIPTLRRTLKLMEGFPKSMKSNILKRFGLKSLLPIAAGALALGALGGALAPPNFRDTLN